MIRLASRRAKDAWPRNRPSRRRPGSGQYRRRAERFAGRGRRLDRRALWRIGSWGVGAVGAVVVAVMANQSSLGLKREQMAAADLTRQAQQIQYVARETQNEARRLAPAIDTLNSDRDRLYSRVTSLEHGLDSVTGAIARQASARRQRRPC